MNTVSIVCIKKRLFSFIRNVLRVFWKSPENTSLMYKCVFVTTKTFKTDTHLKFLV